MNLFRSGGIASYPPPDLVSLRCFIIYPSRPRTPESPLLLGFLAVTYYAFIIGHGSQRTESQKQVNKQTILFLDTCR